MNKQEMNERVARVMGWVRKKVKPTDACDCQYRHHWFNNNDRPATLPDFTDPTTFFKYVVPFAREKGWVPVFDGYNGKFNFKWNNILNCFDYHCHVHEDSGTAGVMAFLKAMEGGK